MTEKHRWYDVIVAWANGEKIQLREVGSNSFWEDFLGDCPLFGFDGWEWRIKPKTKIKRYRMAMFKDIDKTFKVIAVDIDNSCIDAFLFTKWIGDTVEVEIEE